MKINLLAADALPIFRNAPANRLAFVACPFSRTIFKISPTSNTIDKQVRATTLNLKKSGLHSINASGNEYMLRPNFCSLEIESEFAIDL